MHEDSYIDRSEGSDLGGLTSGHSNHLVDQVPADSQLEGVISDHFRDHMYHVSSAAFVFAFVFGSILPPTFQS